jgi:hypothetical protein
MPPLPHEAPQQQATVQNCFAFPVEALPSPRTNGLRPVNAVLQAEHDALAGAIDRRLDRVAVLDRYRIAWTG